MPFLMTSCSHNVEDHRSLNGDSPRKKISKLLIFRYCMGDFKVTDTEKPFAKSGQDKLRHSCDLQDNFQT